MDIRDAPSNRELARDYSLKARLLSSSIRFQGDNWIIKKPEMLASTRLLEGPGRT